MAVILVCGSRYWTWGEVIAAMLEPAPKDTIVVHGDALGADYLTHLVCTSELGLHPIPVPAKWDKYGRAAGPLRNKEMLLYRPKMVIAFHDQLHRSRGTKNMLMLATKQNIPTYLVKTTWLERGRNVPSLSPSLTSGLEAMVSRMIQLHLKPHGGLEPGV